MLVWFGPMTGIVELGSEEREMKLIPDAIPFRFSSLMLLDIKNDLTQLPCNSIEYGQKRIIQEWCHHRM